MDGDLQSRRKKKKKKPDMSQEKTLFHTNLSLPGDGLENISNRSRGRERHPRPARSTRSIGRCSALGVGLRAWRGERVFGVEAGELGSAGSSGGG